MSNSETGGREPSRNKPNSETGVLGRHTARVHLPGYNGRHIHHRVYLRVYIRENGVYHRVYLRVYTGWYIQGVPLRCTSGCIYRVYLSGVPQGVYPGCIPLRCTSQGV